jgi:hypothetical protein
MSTITAVGPALDLDGPLPVAPPYSLLSVPGVIVGDGDRWMNGVNFWGFPSDVPETWEPCSTGTYRTKVEGGEIPLPRFDPFALYEAISCSTISVGDAREFANRAAVVLKAAQSYPVELALSQGVVQSTNPFFGDANLNILAGGAAVAPEVGIAYLEDAIGGTARAGMIHITPSVAGYLGFNLFREIDPDGVPRSKDEYLVTAAGTTVAVGGGYIGADPITGASPSTGQSWAFATGPIQVRLSDLQMVGSDIRESLDRTSNDVTFRAEKYAMASWDTALQAGVLIDWSP